MHLCLALTHACNLACSYCYAGEKRPDAMAWETARRAIDFAFAVAEGDCQLGFFGGEPLLEWELLQRATEYTETVTGARNLPLKTTVTTNATLLTADHAAYLHRHGFYPALSIDGNRAMHDTTRRRCDGGSSFDACMRGLAITRDHFPEFEVIIVPDPANVRHLADSVRFLVDEQHVRRIAVNPNFYTPWPDPALDTWRQQVEILGDFYLQCYRNNHPIALNAIDAKIITHLKQGFECRDRCNFGQREIAIAPSGRIYPCERLIGTDTDHAMVIGNVFEGFDEPKRSRILSRRGNVNPDCITCGLRNRCMNWCCCINYTLTGAIDETDGIVCFHERLAIAVADRVASRLFDERNPHFLARFYYV